MNTTETRMEMRRLGICVVIPTYNNVQTIAQVVEDVLTYCQDVIVVNDGSNDGTEKLLEEMKNRIVLCSYQPNKGKGTALSTGFQKAREMGFRHAITMDADGQHFAADLPLFADSIASHPDSIIIGSRQFDNPNMPQKSSFANRFSNFWFTVQTGQRLPDTQTGFRLYPLMPPVRLLTSRYEAELELLVRSAWHGIRIIPIPIQVYYPPKEVRVTHFRPGIDFFRISVLNTFLTLTAIIYGYPSMLFHYLSKKIKK